MTLHPPGALRRALEEERSSAMSTPHGGDTVGDGTSDVPNTLRLLPPLTVGEEEWEFFFRALGEVAAS